MAVWTTITSAHLNDYLVAAQMAVLHTAALARGQTDPFASVMADRVNYIRNRISKKIRLSATALTIPPELKTSACMLIIEAMQVRIPMLELTEDQKTMIKDAKNDLDIAGTDKLPISTPDDPVEDDLQRESNAAVQSISSNPRQATRTKLSGF